MWRDADACARARHWPAVERVLARLPARLREQLTLVEYELALRWSDTGELSDAFAGAETPPIISLGPWLLADLGAAEDGDASDDQERRLVLAGVLLAARVHVAERLRDEAAFPDADSVALVGWLTERATAELRAAVPAGSFVVDALDDVALDDAEAALARWASGAAMPHADADADAGEAVARGPWAAPLRRVALAALAAACRGDLADAVGALVTDMAAGLQVRAELATLDADLQAGRVTWPIRRVAAAAGIPVDPPPDRERLLGAMVATGSAPTLLATAVARLEAARTAAVGAGLPTLAAWLADAITSTDERRRGTAGGPAPPTIRPLIERAPPPVATALDMAERYLLADPTLRESWETHREGMLGSPEVASRYPAGLVLEILGRHGLDVASAVDSFLAFTAGNRFRYYDHPRSDPDTDTVGVFLRLRGFASDPAAHDGPARDVLDAVRNHTARSGAVPVWLRPVAAAGDGPSAARGPATVLALGEGCATVAAHLLLGLREAGLDGDGRTLEVGIRRLVDRIADVGLAANVNYPPFYALAILFRLLGNRAATRAVLLHELEERLARPARTPQDAALRALACVDAGRPDLLDPVWRPIVLRGQRMDGSWLPEPFAPAPNRGRSVTWYSSATLTTALCYDALRRAEPSDGPSARASSLTGAGQMVG